MRYVHVYPREEAVATDPHPPEQSNSTQKGVVFRYYQPPPPLAQLAQGPPQAQKKIGRGRVSRGNLFGGLAPSSQRHYSEHCCRMVNDDALLC